MISDIIQYSEPLFRPPSEARSLILQATIGCSWNKCSFCEMYSSKKFKVRKESDIFNEIQQLSPYSDHIRKVFLADGNSMVLSADKIMRILNKLNKTFPKLNRISAYALPKDLETKSDAELKEMADAGLKLIYTGIETGDDELLRLVNKGETFQSTVNSLQKARKSGIKLSVMILNGLGGKVYSDQHAINSARAVNEIEPEYLSTLVLSYPYGIEHFRSRFDGDFTELNKGELITEMGNFISELQLDNTIFRSDHASNYLVLKGVLNRDKSKLLEDIKKVTSNPDQANLRPEYLRGL